MFVKANYQILIQFYENEWAMIPTSFPGSSLFSRKDPGNCWSRGSENIDCLRECRKSIILLPSTSALYTSIARSECSCTINFENHIYLIYVKILAKFDFCLLLNYINMLNRFLYQQVMKSNNKNVWSYALLFFICCLGACSLGALKGTFISHVSARSRLWFTYLQSYNMSQNYCYLETVYIKLCIDLLVNLNFNRGLENDCMFIGRGFRQRLHIWIL
jgi:hypothetical protein